MQLWMYETRKRNDLQTITGVNDAEVPPVLIPNTEVKPYDAEDTLGENLGENMGLPIFLYNPT